MKFIRSLYQLEKQNCGCVATIGNFDGVHVGHKAILQQLRCIASGLGLPTLVILFEPQPVEFFAPDKAPPRLMRLREKLSVLKTLDIDNVLCIRFNKQLANLPADNFIKDILVDKLSLKHLLVGDDFRFGAKRQGDFKLLCEAGKQYQFDVQHIETINLLEDRVSSTRIRSLLVEGDLKQANQLLGRPYSIRGKVFHGDKRGRTIGFPTANIKMQTSSPLSGVYAVEAIDSKERHIKGVVNIGKRPTVGGLRVQLEAHLFDFDEDIYEQSLQINFFKRLRDEKKFSSLDELKQQITIDACQGREFFQK
jgi:riboflavin kinase / FMN adenylyltransferase